MLKTVLVVMLMALLLAPASARISAVVLEEASLLRNSGHYTDPDDERVVGLPREIEARTPVDRRTEASRAKARAARLMDGMQLCIAGYEYDVLESYTKFTVIAKERPGKHPAIPLTMFFDSRAIHPSFAVATIIAGCDEVRRVRVTALRKPVGDPAFLGSWLRIDPILTDTYEANSPPAPAMLQSAPWAPTPQSPHVIYP